MTVIGAGLLIAACNSGVPEPATVDIPSVGVRVTIVRVATDPFLPRHNLTLTVTGRSACSTTSELFPDTGHAGRRNVYVTGTGLIYIVGQFDARVIEPRTCGVTLSEFRHLDRTVSFVGSFDEDQDRRWTYYPASVRPEQPFEKRI